MDEGYQRCMRCRGRKRVYRVGNAYSYIDTGGIEVNCPMCLGSGKIKKLELVLQDVKNKNKSSRKSTKDKDDDRKEEKND